MKKYVVTLLEEEREALSTLISKGKHRSQQILNALTSLGCDAGEFRTVCSSPPPVPSRAAGAIT